MISKQNSCPIALTKATESGIRSEVLFFRLLTAIVVLGPNSTSVPSLMAQNAQLPPPFFQRRKWTLCQHYKEKPSVAFFFISQINWICIGCRLGAGCPLPVVQATFKNFGRACSLFGKLKRVKCALWLPTIRKPLPSSVA